MQLSTVQAPDELLVEQRRDQWIDVDIDFDNEATQARKQIARRGSARLPSAQRKGWFSRLLDVFTRRD